MNSYLFLTYNHAYSVVLWKGASQEVRGWDWRVPLSICTMLSLLRTTRPSCFLCPNAYSNVVYFAPRSLPKYCIHYLICLIEIVAGFLKCKSYSWKIDLTKEGVFASVNRFWTGFLCDDVSNVKRERHGYNRQKKKYNTDVFGQCETLLSCTWGEKNKVHRMTYFIVVISPTAPLVKPEHTCSLSSY